MKKLAARLWPTIFGELRYDKLEEMEDAERIELPPEPMFRDPMGGDWKPIHESATATKGE